MANNNSELTKAQQDLAQIRAELKAFLNVSQLPPGNLINAYQAIPTLAAHIMFLAERLDRTLATLETIVRQQQSQSS